MNANCIHFREDKENGVVVAQIYDIEFDAIDKINRNFISTVTSKIFIGNNWDKSKEYLMPRTMKAVAKCSPDDVYDFEVGKRVAVKKLTEKYNKSIDKRITRFYSHMSQACKNIEEYMKNHVH